MTLKVLITLKTFNSKPFNSKMLTHIRPFSSCFCQFRLFSFSLIWAQTNKILGFAIISHLKCTMLKNFFSKAPSLILQAFQEGHDVLYIYYVQNSFIHAFYLYNSILSIFLTLFLALFYVCAYLPLILMLILYSFLCTQTSQTHVFPHACLYNLWELRL